jgi:hypothetical protein
LKVDLTDFTTSLKRSLPVDAAAATGKKARPSTLQMFLEDDITTDNGPWRLQGHEPFGALLSLIDEVIAKKIPDVEISLLKAEQIAATTTIGLGTAFHLAADLGRNVGYFLPNDAFARKFGRTRLKNTVRRSEYLSSRMRDVDAVNQATVKEFDGKFLYVLGLESMMGAISTPLDAMLYDEVDMLPAENMEWSQGRVAHSDLRLQIFFSAGYTPGAGIEKKYREGSQHRWLIDCKKRGCKKTGICLEDEFPKCMAQIGSSWTRVCPDCKEPLDIVKNGRFVPLFPAKAAAHRYSFRISALSIGAMSGNNIMKRYEKALRKKSLLAKFRSAILAIPDAGALQPITDAELNKMQRKGLRLEIGGGERARYAGMDTGDLCHFFCYERTDEGQMRLVWLEEIDSDKAFEEVSQLIFTCGITQLVIDKKPLTTLARALAYQFPQIVALQDFRESSELEVVDEEHLPEHTTNARKYRCVKVNRDESLDDMTGDVTDAKSGLLIPDIEDYPVLTILADHLKNLRKERTEDKKGRAVDKYVKSVANHFGMALNSARIAELIAPAYLPFDYTPAVEARRSDGFKRSYT